MTNYPQEIPPPPLTGMRSAQCPKCRRVFSTVSNFDSHLLRGGKGVSCQFPGEAGLVQDDRGVWKMPGDGRFLSEG